VLPISCVLLHIEDRQAYPGRSDPWRRGTLASSIYPGCQHRTMSYLSDLINRTMVHVPDLHQPILVQARLTKHLSSSLSGNEPILIRIPSSKNLVVILLFLLCQHPGDFGRLDRWVLDEGLELLLKGLLGGLELRHSG